METKSFKTKTPKRQNNNHLGFNQYVFDKKFDFLLKYRSENKLSTKIDDLSKLLFNISTKNNPIDGLNFIYKNLEGLLLKEFFKIFDFLIDTLLNDKGVFLKNISILPQLKSDYRVLSKYEAFVGFSYIFFNFTHHDYNLLTLENGKVQNFQIEKVKCLLNYIYQIKLLTESSGIDYLKENSIIIYRNSVTDYDNLTNDLEFNKFFENSKSLLTDDVELNLKDSIYDLGDGKIEGDFANKYIGGGVLRKGCVQEEIRFIINPELITFMCFPEFMVYNETIYMIGTEKFSNYTGYSHKFKFDSNNFSFEFKKKYKTFKIKSSEYKCVDSVIIAFNALKYFKYFENFKSHNMIIDLKKAYSAFKQVDDLNEINKLDIVTGKWGCGAYKGDTELKFIIQWLVASVFQRKMIFSFFGDEKNYKKILKIVELNKKLKYSVSDIFKFVIGKMDIYLPNRFSLINSIINEISKYQK